MASGVIEFFVALERAADFLQQTRRHVLGLLSKTAARRHVTQFERRALREDQALRRVGRPGQPGVDGRGSRLRVARRAPDRGGRDVLCVPAKLRRRDEQSRGMAHHCYPVGGVHRCFAGVCVGKLLIGVFYTNVLLVRPREGVRDGTPPSPKRRPKGGSYGTPSVDSVESSRPCLWPCLEL